ncbi:MAG: hypothetical protein HYZ53_14580 [Planctomycetes bacterium]|nr:hypothetical protein [Planctomycetota bacterium]
MPAFLTEGELFEVELPAAWKPILADLRAFGDLVKEAARAHEHAVDPATASRLGELHGRLVAGSAALLEPDSLADLTEAEVARLFARAVLFLARLKQAVTGDEPVLDTAGSRTLAHYEAGFYRAPETMRSFRERLCVGLGLPAAELEALEAEVDRDLGDARRRQAVVSALRAEFGLRAGAADLERSVHALFRTLYPDVPLAPDELRIIVTGTMFFFCIPFHGTELLTPRFRDLTEEGKAPVRDFLRRLTDFTQEQFAHFPAFGFLREDDVDAGLLARLAARTCLSAADVARELGRLVTILPLAEIDKYVIHDVWGHGWQASMLRFEDAYGEVARYADPLRLAEDARSRAGGGLAFRACFRGTGDALEFDPERFRRFVQGELAERLPVALSAVLAEMMADVVEYKFLEENPSLVEAMPSSSLFKLFPTKLDLTLRDVPFYFGQATKVFRLWAKSPERQAVTREELVVAGATPAAAVRAVARAVEEWDHLAATSCAPRLAWADVGADRIRVNAFTRVALNFLGVHRSVLETYRRAAEVPPTALPSKSYKDLLVLGASVFFEADRPRNLWRVDEFLSLRFVPLCRRLGLGG